MNVGPSMGALAEFRIRVPPYHSTTTISAVPMNSLTGCARAWRMLTRLAALRNCSLLDAKRFDILSSARKALMTLSPPSVSSNSDMVSLQNDCTTRELALSLRPIEPITQIITGPITRVNIVSCQLIATSVPRYTSMSIGFLISMSRDWVMEFSISDTSPLIRVMISPLRSLLKNPMGRLSTLS